METNHDLVNLD